MIHIESARSWLLYVAWHEDDHGNRVAVRYGLTRRHAINRSWAVAL